MRVANVNDSFLAEQCSCSYDVNKINVNVIAEDCTGWRPVMAVFYYTFISSNRNIVSSDSTSLSK